MVNGKEIIRYFSQYSNIPENNISYESNLYTDLGLTSLDFVTIIYDLEEKYNININETVFVDVYTIKDVIDIFENYS